MAKIRLTKEYNFEMAHALWNYDGLCKHIHGHSYKLRVTIIGEPINDDSNPKNGMVMDFGELKKIVNNEIIDKLDHALVLSSKSDFEKIKESPEMGEKIIIKDYQPTCENMIAEMADIISSKLPSRVKLHSLKLNETASSYAEWHASDQ